MMRRGWKDQVTVCRFEKHGVHKSGVRKANVEVKKVYCFTKLELYTYVGVLAVEVVHESLELFLSVFPQSQDVVLEP